MTKFHFYPCRLFIQTRNSEQPSLTKYVPTERYRVSIDSFTCPCPLLVSTCPHTATHVQRELVEGVGEGVVGRGEVGEIVEPT